MLLLLTRFRRAFKKFITSKYSTYVKFVNKDGAVYYYLKSGINQITIRRDTDLAIYTPGSADYVYSEGYSITNDSNDNIIVVEAK